MKQRAFAFDVEGTLIDCAPQILLCWAGTLSLLGRDVGFRSLQAFSGMDGNDVRSRVLCRRAKALGCSTKLAASIPFSTEQSGRASSSNRKRPIFQKGTPRHGEVGVLELSQHEGARGVACGAVTARLRLRL